MEETKRCPYCGEEILAIAKKCKHCGEWLETKEPEKEKKACPVCGEQIDVDVEICPYCKEPTRFGDSEQKSKKLLQNRINKEVRDDGGIYCKNCRTPLSVNSDVCTNCRDNDPFYFKKVEKINKILAGISIAIVIVLLHLTSEYMGLRINIESIWLSYVVYMVIVFVLFTIVFSIIKPIAYYSTVKNYEDKMRQLFNEIGNAAAIEWWKAKVKEIL